MKKIYNNRGYTLLFATITAAVVLGVAVFITSISRKQFILSSTARDSLFAIYNADSAIECATMTHDEFDFETIGDEDEITFSCIGPDSESTYTPIFFAAITPPAGFTEAYETGIPVIFPENRGCAQVTFKVYRRASGETVTFIEALGYNLGDETTCPIISPRSVERAIRLTYE